MHKEQTNVTNYTLCIGTDSNSVQGCFFFFTIHKQSERECIHTYIHTYIKKDSQLAINIVIMVVSYSGIFSIFSMDVLSPSNEVLVCIHKMCKYNNALYISAMCKYAVCS